MPQTVVQSEIFVRARAEICSGLDNECRDAPLSAAVERKLVSVQGPLMGVSEGKADGKAADAGRAMIVEIAEEEALNHNRCFQFLRATETRWNQAHINFLCDPSDEFFHSILIAAAKLFPSLVRSTGFHDFADTRLFAQTLNSDAINQSIQNFFDDKQFTRMNFSVPQKSSAFGGS
jgi:hypothetical protein